MITTELLYFTIYRNYLLNMLNEKIYAITESKKQEEL